MNFLFVIGLLASAACAEEILSYDAGDHSHTASGDPGSSVTGSYSLQTPEGKTITVEYTADENGYVAVSDALPQPVEVPEAPAVPAEPETKAAADDAEVKDEVKATVVHAPAVYATHPFVAPLPYAYAAHPLTYAVDPCTYSAVPCTYTGSGFAYSTGSVHLPYFRYI